MQASEAREREQHWRELAQTAEARLLEEKKLTMAICSDMTRQAKVNIYLSQTLGSITQPRAAKEELKSGHASPSILCCAAAAGGTLTLADTGPSRSRPGAHPLASACARSRALHYS